MNPVATALGALALAVTAMACGADGMPDRAADAAVEGSRAVDESGADSPILDGELPLLNGEEQDLGEYRGEVVMIVNTASECGFTSQFSELESLYRQRRDDGLVILGFPADDVAGQEPRSDDEIADFCEANFGVSFPMFAKTAVTGEAANPVFKALAERAGAPNWNFNKYLLDREGNVVERYDATDAPDDGALGARLDELLDEKS